MLTVYIEEAHAVDDWAVPLARRTGGHIHFANIIQDRLLAAKSFVADFQYPIPLVCDTMREEVSKCFAGWPERLYVIENSVVVYKGDQGPFGYKPRELEVWLQKRFGH